MITDLPPQERHPEQKQGERFLCNTKDKTQFSETSRYQTLRFGVKAYNVLNQYIPNFTPVFISQQEYDTGIPAPNPTKFQRFLKFIKW